MTKRDLEAIVEAFGHVITPDDIFEIAQQAENRMTKTTMRKTP